MNLGGTNKVKLEGGMASMTDLVFLLLIFFIILSLMSNNQTPIDLPKTTESIAPDPNPITTTVVITEDGRYYYTPNGNEQQPSDLVSIKDAIATSVEKGEPKLRIAGHKNAKYEAVFQVLALAQTNGWDPVLAYDK
jgi:biopolymer transport protein ExbD